MTRFYTVATDNGGRLAIQIDDGLLADFGDTCNKMGLRGTGSARGPTSTLELLGEWDLWAARLGKIQEYCRKKPESLNVLDMDDVKLEAPIPRPPNILCIAFNNGLSERFLDRFKKIGNPGWFLKSPSCVVGSGAEVELPPQGWSLVTTPEVELGLVVGKRARAIKKESAMDAIAGYTIVNDVTAQDLLVDSVQGIDPQRYFTRKLVPDAGDTWERDQLSGPNRIEMKQWDTFAPMGPCFVTKDEVPDPYAMDYMCRLNGQTIMEGPKIELIWSLEEIVHKFSVVMTLEPGDVISCGNLGRLSPGAVLKPGDVMDLRVGDIGTLTNSCIPSQIPAEW